MKHLLLHTALFFALAAGAQNTNNLVVFSEGGERFYLVINGIKQNVNPETNVKVTGLNQPGYKAKIIFEKPGIPDCHGNVYFAGEADMQLTNSEVVMSVAINKKGVYKLKYVSHTSIASAPAMQNQHTYSYSATGPTNPIDAPILVNNTTTNNNATNNNTTVTTSTTTTTQNVGPNGVKLGVNVDGNNFQMNVDIKDGMNNNDVLTTTTTTTSSSTTTTTHDNVVVNNNMTSNASTNTTAVTNSNQMTCVTAMSAADFKSAKESIKSKSFADTQLSVAKQILGSNCLSSAQVKEIMLLFSFEESKLDFAKFAYGKTVDRNNFYKLNDAFSFESSIEELNTYIATQK
jgi:Domain of unknown function (DUF4476)